MAELDEKLLKTLDDRLKNMLTTITSLDSALNTVVANSKSSLNDLISLFQASGASLTDMLKAFKGNRLADLLGIKDATSNVKELKEEIERLQKSVDLQGDAEKKVSKKGKVSWFVPEGKEWEESGEQQRAAINRLEKARQELRDISLSDEQIMERIVALINKAATETQREEEARARGLQKASEQQAVLAKSYKEIDEARSIVSGGKKYGELMKIGGEQFKKYEEFSSILTSIIEQQDAIEKEWAGSKDRGAEIYKQEQAIANAKKEASEAQKQAKQEEARQEKELNKAIKDEEKTKKKDEEDYLGLLKRRNELLEKTYTLTQNLRNANLAEKSTDAFQTRSQSQISSNSETIKKLNEDIKLYEDVGIKLTAEGQQKKEEMEIAHQNKMTNIRLQGEQARQRIEERKKNKTEAESKRDAKEEEKIQRQADAIVKRKIDLENKIRRIENDRAIRQQTNSNISKQALKAEGDEYTALKDRVKQLTDALAKLEGKQAGVTAKAEQNNAPYKAYVDATEEKRKAKAIEDSTKKLKEQKRTLDSMLPSVQRLASAFGVAFSVRGLAQFGKKLIETRGEFELQQVALRSILQNKQLADEIWDKTMQAALQSPFTAMQLTKYTKQLAAYRIETDKLFDTTKRLADVSAGLGVDMQRLILAYGQVKAANHLRASEIRQFTEAGVNILGELSQYFTETREGMYDTAKVMDMVTKRMVKFEDVEAIFKRMTDQGGIFYEMQYVQSQTVKGQINKLRDAYDQMLNSIGKANEGVLKDMVSLLNSIVKNWRTWAVVLKSIAWGAVIGYLSKFALPLMGIGKASVATLRSIVRLRQGVQSLGASLKANLPMLGIFAATAVITALNNLRKKMNEVNKEIDEQNLRLYETRQNFEGMKSKIEENNRILKDADSKTEDLNKAQKENESIMQRLRNEYPQLADQMQIATNGIIDMNDALDANIRKLNEQMTVLNAMKQGNWFSDSDQKNLADWQGALATMKTTLIAAQSEARKKVMQMELGGETDEPLYDIYKRVADIDLSGNILDAVNAFNLLNGEVLAYQSNLYKGTPTRSESLYSILGIKVGNLQANWSENRVKDVLERLAPTLQSYYENGIKDNADFMKEINEQYDDNVTKFIQANAEKINQATLDGLNNANSILINTLKPQTAEMKTFLNQELNRLFGTTGIDYFSTSTKGTTPTTADPEGDKQSKIDAAWRRRINLIEEMKKRYDELSKSAFGYAKSEDSVRKAFDDSFGEIFKGTGINMNQIDFTSMSGMMESMKVLLEKAKGVSDSVREELMKKIDSFEAQITIDAQVRVREDFGKQMEKAFNDYELTLELDKLNISSEAAKDLFPEFDSQTLGELQDAMQEFYEKQGASFDEEDLKAYKQWSDKIDAEILKSRKEKAKEYSKYLEKEYSERAKVEMQYAKDVAFVTANFNGEQQKNILKGIEDKYQKDINELTWKSFKESAFYVEMMDDLSSVPADYMKIMLDKIEELLAHPETLSPRALKEAINARQKILEAQMDINSISVMRESLKEMRDAATDVGGKTWAQTKKRLDEEQTAQAEKLKGLEEEIRCYEELQGQLKGLEQHDEAVATANRALPEDVISMLENTDVDTLIGQYSDELDSLLVSEDAATSAEKDANAEIQARIEYLQRIIPLLESYRTALNERAAYQATDAGENALFARNGGETSSLVGETINEYKKEADEVSNRLSELKKWQKAFKNFSDGMAKWNGAVADAITKVGAMGDAFYDTFDALGGETNALTEGWKEFGDTMVQTITQALTLIPQLVAGFIAAGTSINAAMGLIGLIAEAVQLILVAVGAVAKLHDARYEREIEIQQKKIDDLQRAYDRLEKSIEKTFDTVSYMREYNQEVQNLNEQYEALAKQIDAEKAKKNVDEDKLQDYADKQQEIIDNLEEIKREQIDTFGGIGEDNYRSAAEGFVDAWKSAFLETGDGLQGLQDHFDEFLNDWFVKQATMKIAANKLAPLFQKIDQAVGQYGDEGTNVSWRELQEINELKDSLLEQTNEQLKELAGVFGLGGEGSLSGLAAGIQGMTEEQANVLAGYWNDVRGHTSRIDMNVATIVSLLSNDTRGGGGGVKGNIFGDPNVETNPMLKQLDLIAVNTAATHRILESVTKSGHSQGGYGIKVFAD